MKVHYKLDVSKAQKHQPNRKQHAPIPTWIHDFPYVEHGGLNLVLMLAKSLTCITEAYNVIICNTM